MLQIFYKLLLVCVSAVRWREIIYCKTTLQRASGSNGCWERMTSGTQLSVYTTTENCFICQSPNMIQHHWRFLKLGPTPQVFQVKLEQLVD